MITSTLNNVTLGSLITMKNLYFLEPSLLYWLRRSQMTSSKQWSARTNSFIRFPVTADGHFKRKCNKAAGECY